MHRSTREDSQEAADPSSAGKPMLDPQEQTGPTPLKEPSPQRRFPDLFIVGAAKAGTTSLFYYLNQHPDIFMSVIDKEPGYFCDIWGTDNLDDYRALFADAQPGQLRGEASTAYLTCPASAGLIHKANPDAKTIVMLRNPVDRAHSLYNQMVKYGHETLYPFEKALAAEPRRRQRDPHKKYIRGYHYNYLYVESGKYSSQVQRYLDQFPSKNVKIILFDDLIDNTRATVDGVFRFLGLDPGIPIDLEPQNQSRFPRSVKLQFLITNVFGRGLKSLRFRYGGREIGIPRANRFIRRLRDLNMGVRKPPPLKPETRARLLAQLKPDIELTARLIGRNLDSWMSPRG